MTGADSNLIIIIISQQDNTMVPLGYIYLPNTEQIPFLHSALSWLNNFNEGDIFLGSDLNLIVDPLVDKNYKLQCWKPYRATPTILAELLNDYDLTNVW